MNNPIVLILFYVVIIGGFWWLLMRPQKKEQKRVQLMLSELAVGDTVLTTSGFYGVVIDITDEDVIVEFGSNKNCRIPMQKSMFPRWMVKLIFIFTLISAMRR